MKKFYLSKLVWLGIIQTIIGILTLVLEYMKTGQPWNPPGILFLVIGVLTIVLRIWFTETPIER
jgi:drug/metabolite transporter (DMT)-like permease